MDLERATTDHSRPRSKALAGLLLLVFGLGVLAYLTLVDRTHWFTLKPATGTAAAMAAAADRPASR